MKLLLHTCCAPCSVYCIKALRTEKIEPTLFWYNPNIHPYAEYKARRDCLREYARQQKVELILEDVYGLDEFVCAVTGTAANDVNDVTKVIGTSGKSFENTMLMRCQNYCYPKRLRKVFEYAREHGYDTVSSTLLYSIYQQHNIIKDLMEQLAKEFGVAFLYRDFREGWREGQDEARKTGLYMQKYCGCVFSEEESMLGREVAKSMKKSSVAPTNKNVRKIIEQQKVNGLVDIQKLKRSVL